MMQTRFQLAGESLGAKMFQSWRQWIVLGIWLVLACTGCDSQIIAVAAPSPSKGLNQSTVEVVPMRSIGLVNNVPISVEVHNGDISVVALDATQFFSGAIFIEDDILYTQDITETLQIRDKTEMQVRADDVAGVKGPRAVTHMRVPENVTLNLHARNGSIFVAGRLGNVTAAAEGGKIEVRGQTRNLTLTTQGDNGITVDGETGTLVLVSDKGPVDVATGMNPTRVTVKTAGGNVIFSGKLAADINSFTTATNGQITLMMPRDLSFDIIARTVGKPISVQYPTTPYRVLVCATMDQGWPVDLHVEGTQNKLRGQITVQPVGDQVDTPVVISGTIGPSYLMFHTTMRNFTALLPDLSDLSLDQVTTTITYPDLPTGQAAAAPVPTAAAGQANAQSMPASSDPAVAAGLASFMNQAGDVATAAPLDAAPASPFTNPAPTVANAAFTPSGRAVPMKGDNCPLPLPSAAAVRIYLVSEGGQIRILQMSPGN